MDRVALIICSTVAFLSVLAAFIILSLKGIDTSNLLPFVIGIATIIPGVAAWRNTQVIKKQNEL